MVVGTGLLPAGGELSKARCSKGAGARLRVVVIGDSHTRHAGLRKISDQRIVCEGLSAVLEDARQAGAKVTHDRLSRLGSLGGPVVRVLKVRIVKCKRAHLPPKAHTTAYPVLADIVTAA